MSQDALLPNAEHPLIWINPERMSGVACFYKTRVPVSCLFTNLEGGVSLEEWLDAFPPITREQALAVFDYVRREAPHLAKEHSIRKSAAQNAPVKNARYRTFGSQTFAEADAELGNYWRSRTPQERLEALEDLRVRIYGEETINARIPRVFGVPEPRRS